MKKIILVLCILGLTATAHAACNGGTERGGFCVSNVQMNWWSAAAWCQANGKTLATMYDVCPNWDGNTGSGKCPVLGDNKSVWTATASGSDHVFLVALYNGSVDGTNYHRNLGFNFYALCK